MVFSELTFLYAFLPLNLLIYFLAKDIRTKNTVLLVFSLLFYAWGEPVYLLLLVGMALVNWYIALNIGRAQRRGRKTSAKRWMVSACVANLGSIGIFKYTGFLLGNLQAITGFPETVPSIMLPIGISFYTFQMLSYVVDVYRQDVAPQRSFRNLLLYVSLFHQCIAGPIVRYSHVAEEIMHRKVMWKDVSEGITRFTVGLAKKAVLANHCSYLADQLIGTVDNVSANASVAAMWLGMIAYTFHIYLDFSAYSDMAIGMGRMVGFHYLENFNYPYIAQSVTDFWRRWHISLSTFFRDYVYIPMGGNRRGFARQIFNMFVVWFLTGLWHGASWNFVLWGLYFFVFLVIEKKWLLGLFEKAPKVLRHLYLLLVVVFGWVLFRMETFADILTVIGGMFGLNGNAFIDSETQMLLMNNVLFFILAAVACTPFVKKIGAKLERRIGVSNVAYTMYAVVQIVAPVVLLLLSTAMLVGDSYNPFIYFQF